MQAVTELKTHCADVEAKQFLAEVSECDARECLTDIFGTDKIDFPDEGHKEKIRGFV